jgi:hypothetical protein
MVDGYQGVDHEGEVYGRDLSPLAGMDKKQWLGKVRFSSWNQL